MIAGRRGPDGADGWRQKLWVRRRHGGAREQGAIEGTVDGVREERTPVGPRS